MKEEELKLLVTNLRPYTDNTVVAEMKIENIGLIEIEVELRNDRKVNLVRLNNIIDFVVKDLMSIKAKSIVLLNSLANIKRLKSFEDRPNINFNLVGISINNDDSIHNQFKLVYSYNSDKIHINEDILGYRTINFSGEDPHFYISGVNWIY